LLKYGNGDDSERDLKIEKASTEDLLIVVVNSEITGQV
jgi:hypothetical protein